MTVNDRERTSACITNVQSRKQRIEITFRFFLPNSGVLFCLKERLVTKACHNSFKIKLFKILAALINQFFPCLRRASR